MPQRPEETLQQWRERALQEVTDAGTGVRQYVQTGTEHSGSEQSESPEHAAAADRYARAEADLEAAEQALEDQGGATAG